MPALTDYQRYDDAQTFCSSSALWALFDGDKARFNITSECVDRHAAADREAVIVARADGTASANAPSQSFSEIFDLRFIRVSSS